MKNGLDPNKLFAAVLIAALVAALSGFFSHKLVAVHQPKEKGYAVASAEGDAGHGGEAAAAAPKEAEPIDALMASANIENGKKASRACAACHTFEPGGPNRVGPNLAAVYGGKQAGVAGFAYSDALKKHTGTWNVEELNKWLFNPKTYAPGTKMALAIQKAQDRADIIAYMKSLSGK